ncbi:MAG: hypothetical protein AAGI44_01045 [Pseudomonadota bacterium]
MIRATILFTSIALLACAVLHIKLGGLLTTTEGKTIYSNDLVSSGGDDSALVTVGLAVFIIPLALALFKAGFIVAYYLSLCWLCFWLLLVNVDVPVAQSVALGDYVLLASMVIALVPAVCHLTSKGLGRRDRRPNLGRYAASEFRLSTQSGRS